MNGTREIHVVFDARPGKDMPTLVEIEDESGRSIDAGQWRQRPDGYWELVFQATPPDDRG